MSDSKQRKTPGVYVTEQDAFPPSIIGVQTAVPAFIGYTEQAMVAGQPVGNQAIKIRSMAEFEAIFGAAFKRMFRLEAVGSASPPPEAGTYDFAAAYPMDTAPDNFETRYYRLSPVDDTRYCLFESMRLFFNNGGETCYVVSVGGYDAPVALSDLQAGLDVIAEQVGPTMLVLPDATLLPSQSDFDALVQKNVLPQCAQLTDRVALLDVWGTDQIDPDARSLAKAIAPVIEAFRAAVNVSAAARSYGMAYFPFLHTTVLQARDFDYTHIAAEDRDTLQELLRAEAHQRYGDSAMRDAVNTQIDAIGTNTTPAEIEATEQALTAALPLLGKIEALLAERRNVLPPSGAMAGVYTRNDATKGVWNAPANVSLSSVTAPTLALTDDLQADLNVPIDGKAVNALRAFTGRGTVVWGARTLDGNSNDWRYIQVRRTLIYIEQSIKNALLPFVFAANDGNTWVTVTATVSNFLQGLWSQGGLMGATASEAFSVECGLGSTMTAQDVLEGYMIVQVTLQMIRPAEFIELIFRQKMEGAA